MDTSTKSGLHPILWVAAIAATLFSLVGIASLTGLIGKTSQPEEIAAATPAQEPGAAEALPAPPPATRREDASRTAEATPPATPKSRPANRSSSPTTASSAPPAEHYGTPVALCASCGAVESVRPIQTKGEGTGIGAVAGGVLGGALGNQVGKGTGNTIATIAGAVAGGYAGHQVEKNVRTSTQYQITVRMDDGGQRVLTRKEAPTWQPGDRVEVGPNGELSAAPPASSNRSSF